MIHNDYDSGYETLLTISGTSTMQISKRKQLAIGIFKTVNNLNPNFMKNISSTSTRFTCQKSQYSDIRREMFKNLGTKNVKCTAY